MQRIQTQRRTPHSSPVWIIWSKNPLKNQITFSPLSMLKHAWSPSQKGPPTRKREERTKATSTLGCLLRPPLETAWKSICVFRGRRLPRRSANTNMEKECRLNKDQLFKKHISHSCRGGWGSQCLGGNLEKLDETYAVLFDSCSEGLGWNLLEVAVIFCLLR